MKVSKGESGTRLAGKKIFFYKPEAQLPPPKDGAKTKEVLRLAMANTHVRLLSNLSHQISTFYVKKLKNCVLNCMKL